MTDELELIVAGHTKELESIETSLKSMSRALVNLDNKLSVNTKFPVSTMLSLVSIGLVMLIAFGSYFNGQLAKEARLIEALRASNDMSLVERGRNEVTRERIEKLEDKLHETISQRNPND